MPPMKIPGKSKAEQQRYQRSLNKNKVEILGNIVYIVNSSDDEEDGVKYFTDAKGKYFYKPPSPTITNNNVIITIHDSEDENSGSSCEIVENNDEHKAVVPSETANDLLYDVLVAENKNKKVVNIDTEKKKPTKRVYDNKKDMGCSVAGSHKDNVVENAADEGKRRRIPNHKCMVCSQEVSQ